MPALYVELALEIPQEGVRLADDPRPSECLEVSHRAQSALELLMVARDPLLDLHPRLVQGAWQHPGQ